MLHVSLNRHIGNPSLPIVEAGQHVKKYETIAIPQGHVSVAQHAPSSGVVVSVSELSATGDTLENCYEQEIVLACDGLDLSMELAEHLDLTNKETEDKPQRYSEALRQKLYRRIAGAGIIGMGGAGFPAHVKIREGMNAEVSLCIINGVECEPLSSCDAVLIRQRVGDLVLAAEIIGNMLSAERIVIAVNSNIKSQPLYEAARSAGVEIVIAPARYPAGSEKQLIKIITNNELPLNNLPIHAGVVCFNVASALAILDAATFGKPLVSRMLTLNGAKHSVVETPVGLPICQVVERIEGIIPDVERMTTGGMMMSRALNDVNSPVLKTTNEISVVSSRPTRPKHHLACIRCGECVKVCPIKLQPQLLFQLSEQSDLDDLQDHGLFDCIECGCCDYVCPSHIPLVENFRGSKKDVNSLVEASANRAYLLQRYENHRSRQDNATPAERNAALADTSELTMESIDDELARIKARLEKPRTTNGDD